MALPTSIRCTSARPSSGPGSRRITLLAAAASIILASAGCGDVTGGGTAGTPTAATHGGLSPAAEPASAPPLTRTPAGAVRAVGDGPEGVVVDAHDDLVVVALRGRRLALVSPSPGAVGSGTAATGAMRLVAVPGTARHLQLAGPTGPVLVPGEDTDLLAEIELPSGRVTGTTHVGRQPHDAAEVQTAGGTPTGTVVVSDELGSAVSFVVNGRETARLPGPVQPGGVAATQVSAGQAGAGRVGVVDVRGNALFVYDATSTRLIARLPAGAGPTHAVDLGAGRVAVADTRGSAIEVFSLVGTPRLLARLALPGTPYGLAADPGGTSLWVTLTARNELVRLAVGPSGTLRQVGAARPTVRQPNSVAVDPVRGRVYVAGATADGTLETIDRW
jgi:DNA-binding beta-propeller fold protein YncE